MLKQIGVYYESWWGNLESVDPKVNVVYLAFCKPDLTYAFLTFDGTGLEFSEPFNVIRDRIKKLRDRGVKVLLAVGGGSYWSEPKYVNYLAILKLRGDLACDGIDIDWEVGYHDRHSVADVIKKFREYAPSLYISFTCFSTGAFKPDDGNKSGMNAEAIVKCANMINQVNIMAYDAGAAFVSQTSWDAYRLLYDGPLVLGFETGKQGWGNAILQKEEVERMCNLVNGVEGDHGIFIWSYLDKDDPAGVATKKVIEMADAVKSLNVVTPPKKKPVLSIPSSIIILDSQKKKIKVSFAYELTQ